MVQTIQWKTHTNNRHRNKEIKTIKQIKTQLEDADATVTKADNGNSGITVYENEYNSKIHTFISNISKTYCQNCN